MNLSLLDTKGELMVVSQFTLYGDVRRGRRPSFIDAAPPERANTLYEFFVAECRKQIARVATGQFQALMDVELVNSGPVTILVDSEKQF
jgi:D-aminoacyl-tRNA deacylase